MSRHSRCVSKSIGSSTGDSVNTAQLRAVAVVAPLLGVSIGLMALGGCESNPLNPFDSRDFYVEKADLDRLRHIDEVDLTGYSLSRPLTIDEAAAQREQHPRPHPITQSDQPLALSLADVRAAALENNLGLRVALMDPSIARTFVSEEEARFEWTLSAAARRNKVDTPTASALSGSSAEFDSFDVGLNIPLRTGGTVNLNLPMNRTRTDNVFSTLNPAYEADFTFSISQPLLRGAGNRANTHGIRVARYQQRITDTATKLEAIRILANADRVYWTLYAAHRALDVSHQQYALAVEQLERAQRRFEAQVVPRLEVTRAESGVAQRLEAIILAENRLLEIQRGLKIVMNRDDLPMWSDTVLLIETEPTLLMLDLDPHALADIGVGNRMEMLEEELRLAIDLSTIDFERNRALPLVVLDYQYNVNGLGSSFSRAFSMLNDKRFEDHAFGIRAEIPMGNEAAKARVDRAVLSRIQRLATRELRDQSIRQEVFDVIDRLRADWQRILVARQAVVLATEVLRGEERQFTAGERTSTDVLDAAAQLAEAQLAEVRAIVDYQIDQIDVAFATGTLLGRSRIRWDAMTLEDVD